MGSPIDYPILDGAFSSPSNILRISVWHTEWNFPTTVLRKVLLVRKPFRTKLSQGLHFMLWHT